MTSGLGDFFGEKFDATPKSRIRTLRDYLGLFASDPLLFEPGTSRRYSNAGYVVLGLIIEKITGKTYYDYVRENIYGPAGMTSSDSFMQDAVGREPRRRLHLRGRRREAAARTARQRLRAPGAGKLGRRRLLHGRRPPAVRPGDAERQAPLAGVDRLVLLRPLRPRRPPGAPGKLRGGKGVAGGTAGVNCVLEMDLDTGYTVVVMSNLDPPSAEKVAKTLRQWLGLD